MAAIDTAFTFKVSYDASVILGTVLLQTAPQRGLSDGRMESFLRVMKEVACIRPFNDHYIYMYTFSFFSD